MGTTAECDSLVSYEIHLHRVPTAFSAQGGGPLLQRIALVPLTTEENNQMVVTNIETLHVYSIMYVECLQYFGDNDTSQKLFSIRCSQYSLVSIWLPEEPNCTGWNHSNIRSHYTAYTHATITRLNPASQQQQMQDHIFLERNQRITIVSISFTLISN